MMTACFIFTAHGSRIAYLEPTLRRRLNLMSGLSWMHLQIDVSVGRIYVGKRLRKAWKFKTLLACRKVVWGGYWCSVHTAHAEDRRSRVL